MIASPETRAAADKAADLAMAWGEHKEQCSQCATAARRKAGKCGPGHVLFTELANADAALGVARAADEQPHPDQGMLWQ